MYQQLVVGSDVVVVYTQQYLDYIINQANSPVYIFNNPFSVDKEKKGKSSAANFVSSVLRAHGMIVYPHIQIKILLDEMKLRNWVEYKNRELYDKNNKLYDLIAGDVVVWEQNEFGHYHIGFVHENNLAVSYYGKKGYPTIHDLEFQDLWHGKKRKIVSRYSFQSRK